MLSIFKYYQFSTKNNQQPPHINAHRVIPFSYNNLQITREKQTTLEKTDASDFDMNMHITLKQKIQHQQREFR